MTVAELIAKLRDMPQDAEVLLADWNEGYAEPGKFHEVRLRTADEYSASKQRQLDALDARINAYRASDEHASLFRCESRVRELVNELANARTAVILGKE